MLMEISCCVLLIIMLVYYFYNNNKDQLLPGPPSIPFIGSRFPMTESAVNEMAEKYGSIFMCQIGVTRFLFLADFKIAKEALSLIEYSNRPEWRVFGTIINNKLESTFTGLVSVNGPRWQHNRRFALRHLRDLGLGKSRMEYAILNEAKELVNVFSELADAPVEIPIALNIAILNVIWQLVASHRYDFKNKEVEIFIKHTNDVQQHFLLLSLTEFFPILKYIMPPFVLDWAFGYNRSIKLHEEFIGIVKPFIEEHKRTIDFDNPRDFIDDYLIAMKENESNNESFFEEFDLERSLLDLFVAGNDTVANSTKWIILYLAKYPEIQEKAQKIIDEFVPKDVQPNLDHRHQLVYIDALISESLRKASFANFGLHRATVRNVNLNGYFIPKDTVVFPLPGNSHYDSKYWKNPEVFNPERFIDPDGKLLSNVAGYQPFGLGRRVCLGEPLARMELYLFTSSILQNFTFYPPPGKDVDLTSHGKPFFNFSNRQKILIKKRF